MKLKFFFLFYNTKKRIIIYPLVLPLSTTVVFPQALLRAINPRKCACASPITWNTVDIHLLAERKTTLESARETSSEYSLEKKKKCPVKIIWNLFPHILSVPPSDFGLCFYLDPHESGHVAKEEHLSNDQKFRRNKKNRWLK